METKMKTTMLALSALLLAGSLGVVSYANAATTLTAQNGMTVYVFDKDVGGKPSCYADCAKTWPAYLAKTGEKMSKGWSEVKRTDGSSQWAYDGKPLYFYAPDKKKGDKLGDGIGGIWHIVSE
jgi:predicted lipoprotein with Yx(FWY)xxD motif